MSEESYVMYAIITIESDMYGLSCNHKYCVNCVTEYLGKSQYI